MGFINLDLDAIEGYVANHVRLFLTMAVGLLVFVGFVAISVFFIYVRGEEQTMVPDVQGQELTSALLELQVKELYPQLHLRFTQTSSDKGLVLEQNPLPGTIVKAGRRIQLVVSQGVMINTIENYLGRNVDDVRIDLQAMFAAQGNLSGNATARQLITIKDPLMYDYSAEPPGAILQQRPEPGTAISGPTMLELVVSRGPEDTMIDLPNFVGLSLENALAEIGRSAIDFEFSLRPVNEGEAPGTVVAQTPGSNAQVPSNTRVSLIVTSPENPVRNEVFGLFVYEMAKNPYPLMIRLDCLLPGGERRQLLSVPYAGGRLAVPYHQNAGSVLVLSMLNREIHREEVTPQAESLPMGRF